jgi:hypothetical protein
MAIPPNSLFVRVRHLKKSTGSIYLNDLDTLENHNQHLKIPVYVPYGGTVDIPLIDSVLISHNRGSLHRHAENGLIEAFIFSNQSVADITGMTEYTVRGDSEIVLVDTSAHDVTITLPELINQPQGRELFIKKTTADPNQLILQTQSPDRIDRNSLAIVTTANFGAFELRSAASGWWIVSEYPLPSDITQRPYQEEVFDVTNPAAAATFTLQNTPIEGSEGVYWNGVWLTKGTTKDYTLTEETIKLTQEIQLHPGDQVTINYQYSA